MDVRARSLLGAWVFGILCFLSLWIALGASPQWIHWGWMGTVFFGFLALVCAGAGREAGTSDAPVLPFGPGPTGPSPEPPPATPPPADDAVCPVCGHRNLEDWTMCIECTSPRKRG